MTDSVAADTTAGSAADMTDSAADPTSSVEVVTIIFAGWMVDSVDWAGAAAADSAQVGICLKASADPDTHSTTRMERRDRTILTTSADQESKNENDNSDPPESPFLQQPPQSP